MERILFLVPPNIAFDDFIAPPENVGTIRLGNSEREFGSLLTDIPLGIISLSAYLKKHAPVDTRAIDFNVQLLRETAFPYADFRAYFSVLLATPELAAFQPSMICISAQFTPAYHSVIDLADVCRLHFPDAMILAGGNLVTATYADLLADSRSLDAICYGEGELPLLELLQSANRPQLLATHDAWITHEKAQHPACSFKHQFIDDLDEIPFLDYDILDIAGYRLNPTLSRYAVGAGTGHAMAIMTSRGCPFKCTFCASHLAHGRKMRYYSVDRVTTDLDELVRRYGVDAVIVQDDHFMGDRERPYRIVEAARDRRLSIFFQNALAIYALERPFLELLKSAGVDELVLPIESGSAHMLKNVMHKPLKLDIVHRVVADCREIGIYTDCNIIIGMPGETMADIEDTRQFLKTINGDWFRVFIATPIPGSDMYLECVDNNYFAVSPLKANYKRAVVRTGDWSAEDIQRISYSLNIELNFVHNANMRLGRYDVALASFEKVVSTRPDHAIAHYFMSVCHEHLGNITRAEQHRATAVRLGCNNPFWMAFITMFDIPIADAPTGIANGHLQARP